LKAIRKKLQQIAKLKEKVGDLDAEAQEKVASEADLLREAEALERGEEPLLVEKPKQAASAIVSHPQAGEATVQAAQAVEDPHAAARAKALEPPPGDLGLLLDDETEKLFKKRQKALREIDKLREKDKLDKLQQNKLTAEPSLIEELEAIRAKAAEVLASRRAKAAESRKAPEFAPQPRKTASDGIAWECPNCGKSGKPEDLSEGPHCPHCGYADLVHYAPKAVEADDDEEEAAGDEKKKQNYKDSSDLKTARQKKQPPPTKKRDDVIASPATASWPEVKEVLESGECGVDKSRQKKAICVDKPKPEPPYDTFDPVLLKCGFLTRVEIRCPPGVLAHEDFQLYFPGNLSENLLELILKGNKMPMIPPGIRDLQRIRSIDLSHNAIEVLPGVETWENLSSSLELLDLSFNQLTTVEPLAPLTKLSQLKVDANRLTSLEGVSWAELKQLGTLSAANNLLEAIPEAVGTRAESLEYLELSENKITAIPTEICDLKKLKLLAVTGNPIKDNKVPKALEKGIKDLKAYLSKVKGKAR